MPNTLNIFLLPTLCPPQGALINSIQYGSITIEDTDLSDTATINSVDTSKAAVFFLGSHGSEDPIHNNLARLVLTNATTVTAFRDHGLNGQSMTLNFCHIEFSTGINSVQQNTVTIPGLQTQADQTITEVDPSKAILFFCGVTTVSAEFEWYPTHPRIVLLNSTTVRAGANQYPYDITVGVSVLEFT